jgi:AraC-like DNA-binding protein
MDETEATVTVMDPLAEILRVARVRGSLLNGIEARQPWGISLGSRPEAAVHAVIAGTCWLRVGDAAPVRLGPGDVVLFPTGIAHSLLSDPEVVGVRFDRDAKRAQMSEVGRLTLGGDGALTQILCAAYEYDHEVARPLVSALPATLHVTAADPTSGVGATLRLLSSELGTRAPGASTAVDRLIDLLFIHVLREWLAHNQGVSWLAALSDPTTAAALSFIHERPDRLWSTDSLARAVGVSRATLARRFTSLVGQPPLTYLTRWRMDLAAQALRDTSQPIDVIARQVGYSSEYAFSRAFSRSRGTPPGRYRSRADATA